MQTSDQGIAAIVKHEGIVPAPYFDSVNVKTYGIGHTKSAGSPDPASLPMGMPKDLDKALADVVKVFRKDLKTFEDRVNKHVKVPLSQHQFDALVSFDFNTGGIWYMEKSTVRWRNATLIDTLNSGDYRNAGLQFMNWKTPSSIIGRRQQERDLFLTGKYPSGNAVVWKVSPDGRVIWTPERQLTSQEVIDLVTGSAPATGGNVKPPKAEPILPNPVRMFESGKYTASIDAAGNLVITEI